VFYGLSNFWTADLLLYSALLRAAQLSARGAQLCPVRQSEVRISLHAVAIALLCANGYEGYNRKAVAPLEPSRMGNYEL